jgi:hypothetical protein
MTPDPYQHRDGLLIKNPVRLWTELTHKTDGRGTTSGRSILVGRVDYPLLWEGEGRPKVLPGLIIAYPNDIHHAVLNFGQARELAKMLTHWSEGNGNRWPPPGDRER